MNKIEHPSCADLTQTSCDACPIRASAAFREFSPPELDFVRHFKIGEMRVTAGSTVLLEGAETENLYTVLSGWSFRYKSLADGRRQILNFALPGDLLGLQASLFEALHHSVEALTEMRLCIFRRDRLWALYRDHPRLALDITWLTARQELVLDDGMTSLGRRTARERVANLLLHLYSRAEEIGLADENEVELPITQQHLADALGLSLVHTNKTLRHLVDLGLVHWKNRTMKLLDAARLADLSGYEPTDKRPRPFI
jgi:CRP/FNR family transcriptional regulator, anaerobic regulatory protein